MILYLYKKSEFVFAEIIHKYIYIYIHMSALWYERVCVCSPTPTDYGIIQENRFVLRLEEAVVKQY